jgi:hypothetical protein
MKADTLFLAAVVFLVVYWEAAFDGVRHLLGVQPDLLPSLMVYAALTQGIGGVVLVAVGGGLLFDALSANPLAVSVGPLFFTGLVVHAAREVILRDQPFAQAVIGAAAGFISCVLVLMTLLTLGETPILGWGTVWQLAVLTIGSGVAAPLWFVCFGWLHRTLAYRRAPETTFRSDREIRRGR